MVTVLALLGVLVVLFVAAALATREEPLLADAPPDAADVPLPAGPLSPEDVERLRFSLAPRGYRMSEVDAALERLSAELADRDRRIGLLEAAAEGSQAAAVEPAQAADASSAVREASVEDLPAVAAPVDPVEPPAPPVAGPAALSAPLPPEPGSEPLEQSLVRGPDPLEAPAPAAPPAPDALPDALPPADLGTELATEERVEQATRQASPLTAAEGEHPAAEQPSQPAPRLHEDTGASAATSDVPPEALLAALEEAGDGPHHQNPHPHQPQHPHHQP